MKLLATLLATLSLWAVGVPNQDILYAIRMMECSDVEHPPDGDGGNAIGHYQIWEAYWLDATEFSGIGGTYQDCRNRQYAERIVEAYMKRYCPDAWESGDAERISRVHNGGPKGHKKKATLKYWDKVRRYL